jgi:hypothetical protein
MWTLSVLRSIRIYTYVGASVSGSGSTPMQVLCIGYDKLVGPNMNELL